MPFDLFDQTQDKLFTATTYEAFAQEFLKVGCTKCRLASSRTQLVIDRGNPHAKILFIGEGPGEHEDRQGKAFVGPAGKLLDEIMASIGLETNRDSLIINVVKCHPPQNRAPQRDEAETCRPYLLRQIQLVRPKLIILLGATALKHVIPGKSDFAMNEEAGKLFTTPDFPGIQFMVLFHTAYILRDPRKKPLMMEHVQRLRTYLTQEQLLPMARSLDSYHGL